MDGWQSLLDFALSDPVTPEFGGWMLVVLAAGFVILMGLRILNWKLKRSFQAAANIRAIRLPERGDDIELSYEFRFRGQTYEGNGRLSASQLFESRGTPPILRRLNDDLDLPVLYLNQEAYVGEEAIEHALLERKPALMIRFLSADPSRNFPVPGIVTVVQEERSDQQV